MRDWNRWGYDFAASVLRHVGTAGLTAASTCVIDGRFDWRKFGAAIVVGGIVPSLFTFLQTTPVPPDENTKTAGPMPPAGP